MFHAVNRRYPALIIAGILLMFALSGCDMQPAIIDVPTPVPTGFVPAQEPTTIKGQPTPELSKDSSKPTSEPTLGPGQYTNAQGVPFPVPSSAADPIQAVDMQTAWGMIPGLKKIPSLLPNDQVFLLRGIDENGRFLVGEVAPIHQSSPDGSRLALMDLSSKAVTYVPNGTLHNDRSSYSSSGIAVDNDWIVWQQTDGQKVNVEIYNRASGSESHLQIKHLGEPDIPGMLAIQPEVTSASVDHGMFVWAETDKSAAEQGKVATAIKSYDFATGQSAVIGRNGVTPSLSWPYVAWLEPDLSTLSEGEVCSSIVTRNLQSGTTTTSPGRCDAMEVAMHGDWLAATTNPWAFLQNVGDTRRQIIRGDSGPEIHRLTLNDRLVAWAGSSRPAVWDRKLQKMVWLDGFVNASGIVYYPDGCMVNGTMLAWQSSSQAPDPAGFGSTQLLGYLIIYVIDTTQLAPQ